MTMNQHPDDKALNHNSHAPVYVAYDISRQRRRKALHRLLRGFGNPVQESVFLCWVDRVRENRLQQVIDDFSQIGNQDEERIEIIRAKSVSKTKYVQEWVFE